jgi:hypothetical protein
MKLTTSASAALIVAALALGGATPAAFAQDQGPQAGPGEMRHELRLRGHMRGEGFQHGGMRGGGMLGLVCSERGAEMLEHMFVSISHRLELTAEQAPLFDELKTAALTAQTGFADTCATLQPEAASDTAEQPNVVERLQTRIEVDEARIAALSGVLPALEAFHDSLTDEQKAALEPGRGEMREHFGKRQGGPDRRPGQHRMMMQHNG